MLIYIAGVKEVKFLYHFIFLVFVTTFLIASQFIRDCVPACQYVHFCLSAWVSIKMIWFYQLS